jgi:hypothetical protein
MRRLLPGCALLCALVASADVGVDRARAAPAVTCTAAQNAVRLYKRQMLRSRRVYFGRTRSPRARAAFVRRQNAKLRALQSQAARACRPPVQPPAPGPSQIFPGNCKYGSAPYPGYLRVSTRPPQVAGMPSRPGSEWVRYAAWLVDPAGNSVMASTWSGWLQAADGAWATWTGETSFTADWRGNYRIVFQIEWWDRTTRLAWKVSRIDNYTYIDEWNTSWGGPFTSCMRQPV